MEKTKFSDLSTPLKVAIVFAYIAGIICSLAFVSGFIEGFLGA